MAALVTAEKVSKQYGAKVALDEIDLAIEPGRIVGIVGPNGAGKTTLVRVLLGLTSCTGHLSVLDFDPFRERAALMREACFIADVAVMPPWLKVGQALRLLAGVHPKFRRARAESLLAAVPVQENQRIGELSKGVKTQVHLALSLAVDARLLVLDEPTLGLDPLARRAFYDALVNDYMDAERTILVTTNQVEEIEHLLTDVIFMRHGRFALEATMDSLPVRFAAVQVAAEKLPAARAMGPFHERATLGGTVMYFENMPTPPLEWLGKVHRPGIAELCVAKLSEGNR